MNSSSPFSLRKSPQSTTSYQINNNNSNQNQLINHHSLPHVHSNSLSVQSHQSKPNQNNLVSSNKTNGTSKNFSLYNVNLNYIIVIVL